MRMRKRVPEKEGANMDNEENIVFDEPVVAYPVEPVEPSAPVAVVEPVGHQEIFYKVKLLLKRPIDGNYVFFNLDNPKDIRFLPVHKDLYTSAIKNVDSVLWNNAASAAEHPKVIEAVKLLNL